ncbi:hypothetical protein ACP275_06G077200 [Erythranthe tilingii]
MLFFFFLSVRFLQPQQNTASANFLYLVHQKYHPLVLFFFFRVRNPKYSSPS